jgi:DNA-binding PadR family transcriptional regulator
MPPGPDAAAFLPLTPVVFDILVSLAAADRHGYSILTDVRTRTGQTLRPGSLYRALGRLVDDRLIEELDERPDPELDDERRRYYRLTPLGRTVAAAEAARLDAQVKSARAARLLGRKT